MLTDSGKNYFQCLTFDLTFTKTTSLEVQPRINYCPPLLKISLAKEVYRDEKTINQELRIFMTLADNHMF